MNILITGGAGFIGSHIAEFHLNKGDAVCAVDNLSTGSEKNIAHLSNNPKFHFEKGDILTWQPLSQRILWAERIYHMAAVVGMHILLANPVETLTTNILGSERLLRLMSEVNAQARIIVPSSSEIYGPSDKAQLNENDMLLFKSVPRSKWVYATSKLTEELLSLTYACVKGVRATPVRLFNTIGPRQNCQYGMVVPRFIQQAVANEPITVYGDGEQTRSFCDVRDVVQALDVIANNDALIGEVINLGQDQTVTMNQLAKMIKHLAKSDSLIKHIGYKEAYGQEYEDIMTRRPDLTKFHQLTDYQFHWCLEKTLIDLIHLEQRNR